MAKEDDLVTAFRILINISREPSGPTELEAFKAVSHLNLPEGWVNSVLSGWRTYYKRYGKPKDKVLVKKTPARFLAIKMLSRLNLNKVDNPCRLCGLNILKKNRKWHTSCWKALEPDTASGWSLMCDEVYSRDKYTCKLCSKDVRDFKKARSVRRRPYSVDHIKALCLGGLHKVENLQLLCIDCHKEKSKKDVKKLAMMRKLEKNK